MGDRITWAPRVQEDGWCRHSHYWPLLAAQSMTTFQPIELTLNFSARFTIYFTYMLAHRYLVLDHYLSQVGFILVTVHPRSNSHRLMVIDGF